MRKKLLVLAMILVLVLAIAPAAFAAEGMGTTVMTEKELAEALADSNVSVINLGADITMMGTWMPAVIEAGRTLTINGNGKTISDMYITSYTLESDSSGVAGTGFSCDYYAGFVGSNLGTLTINNLNFSGATVDMNPLSEKSTGSSILAVVVGNNRGELVYNDVNVMNSTVKGYTKIGLLHGYSQGGGTFVANHCAVSDSSVVLEADGSDPDAAYSGLLIGYDSGNAARTNGIKIKSCQTSIDGSVKWDGYERITGNGVTYVDCNGTHYGLTCDTYTHGSSGVDAVTFVAQDADGYQYETLADAVAAAGSDGTIKLGADVDISGGESALTVPSGTSITLDLNGKKLKAANTKTGSIVIEEGAALTLVDSTDTAKDGTGTGKIYSETDYVKDAADSTLIQAWGTFTMESGHIYTVRPEDTVHKGQFGVGTYGSNGHVIINGGKIKAGWYAISSNGAGTENDGAAITVNGGTLVSTKDYAIYIPHDGKLTVNGGVIDGASGAVHMNDGEMEITGGTFRTDGTGDTGEWSDGTGGASNAAIMIEAEHGDVTATIKGGSFSASGKAVLINTDAHNANLSITGGTFSADPGHYPTEEGYEAVQYADGTYRVGIPMAQIGTQKYVSLADAVAAATSGAEIDLLCDTEGPGIVFKAGDNIVIDLNGKTYTVNKAVGSSGTVSNGFQFLKGSTVTFKNGTLKPLAGGTRENSAYFGVMLQNYCDLTLDSVMVDCRADTDCQYVLSNNCGNTTITGSTQLLAASRMQAFDLWYGMSATYFDGVSVTFDKNFTGSVSGIIEYGAHGPGRSQKDWIQKTSLVIEAGDFTNASFVGSGGCEIKDANITISGGTFSTDPGVYLAKGYGVSKNENGEYVVKAATTVVSNALAAVENITTPTSENDKTAVNNAVEAIISVDNETLVETLTTHNEGTTESESTKLAEALEKLDTLYIAANDKVAEPVVSPAADAGVANIKADGLALSAAAAVDKVTEADAKAQAVLTVSKQTDSDKVNAAKEINDMVGVDVAIPSEATMIPLAITLDVVKSGTQEPLETAIQPVAPIVITMPLPEAYAGYTADELETIRIIHIHGDNTTEVIKPTITGTGTSATTSFTVMKLSTFVITNTVTANPNAYTVTMTPDKTEATVNEQVTVTVNLAAQNENPDGVRIIDLRIDYDAENLSFGSCSVLSNSGITITEKGGVLYLTRQPVEEAALEVPASGKNIAELVFTAKKPATVTAFMLLENTDITNDNYENGAKTIEITTTGTITIIDPTYELKANVIDKNITVSTNPAAAPNGEKKITEDTATITINDGLRENNLVGETADITFTVAVVPGYTLDEVSYQVNGGEKKTLSLSSEVYTIPKAEITGDVTITVETSVDISITVFKSSTNSQTAYQKYSTYSGDETLVRFKFNNPALTGKGMAFNDDTTIYATDKYKGYTMAALVDMTGKTEESLKSVLKVVDGTNTAVVYDSKINSDDKVTVSDAQNIYDFYTKLKTNLEWAPTDLQLLKADLNGDGEIKGADVTALLKDLWTWLNWEASVA